MRSRSSSTSPVSCCAALLTSAVSKVVGPVAAPLSNRGCAKGMRGMQSAEEREFALLEQQIRLEVGEHAPADAPAEPVVRTRTLPARWGEAARAT